MALERTENCCFISRKIWRGFVAIRFTMWLSWDVRHWKVFPEEDRFRSRTHIVLSHKKHENTENVIWVTSVEEALAKMEKLPGEVYVTGGEQVYREFLPLASKLYLTEVAQKCDADAYFPNFLSDGEWKKMEENKRDGFSFVTYERNR